MRQIFNQLSSESGTPASEQLFSRLPFDLWAILMAGGAMIGSILYDGYYLFRSSAAVGIDGYYYVVQIDELFSNGHFYYATNTPLFLLLLYAAKYICCETVVAIKITVLIFQALLSIGIFLTVKLLTGNRWCGLLGALLTAFAGLHFHYISEFLNNLGALVFLVWGLFFLVRRKSDTGHNRDNWRSLVLPAIFFVGACACHKSAIWLILIFFILFQIGKIILIGSDNETTSILTLKIPRHGTLWAALGLFFLLPGGLAAQSFFKIPEGWQAEFLLLPRLPFGSIGIPEKLLLVLILPGIGRMLIRQPHQGFKKLPPVLTALVAALLFYSVLITLNPFLNHANDITGTVVRLDTMAYLQVAILLPLWSMALVARARENSTILQVGMQAMALMAAILLVGWSLFARLPYGLRSEYLETRQQLIRNLPQLRALIDPSAIVIADHGDEFLITEILHLQAQQTFDNKLAHRQLYWLIAGLKPPEVPNESEESNVMSRSLSDIPLATEKDSQLSVRLLTHRQLIIFIGTMDYQAKNRILWKNLPLRNACLSSVIIERLNECNQ